MRQLLSVSVAFKLIRKRINTRFMGLCPPSTLLAAGCLCLVQPSFAQLEIVVRSNAEPPISGRVERHLNEARDCTANNDFDCARAALENIARRDLNSLEQYRYWISLGYLEFLDGNFTASIEAYRHAVLHSPTEETRQYHMRSVGQLHASMGQFQNAYDALEELLVLNGADPLTERHLTDDGLWRGLDIYLIGDRNLFALGRNPPEYPPEAAMQGLLQGYVDLAFTVTRTGTTRNIRVVASSAPVFESAAIRAAENFRYKPRVVDGESVETVVQDRIEFQPEDLD
jgi:TonB family protein